MQIRYKSIKHERIEDAPFVGALVCSIDCNIGCKGCFNDSLKNEKIKCKTEHEILDEIQQDPFNEGLILAGLEWSLQANELIALTSEALNRNMPVIIYTGYSIDSFIVRVPEIRNLYGELYIKHGAFDETQLSDNHFTYGVKLASLNQKIELIEDIVYSL